MLRGLAILMIDGIITLPMVGGFLTVIVIFVSLVAVGLTKAETPESRKGIE